MVDLQLLLYKILLNLFNKILGALIEALFIYALYGRKISAKKWRYITNCRKIYKRDYCICISLKYGNKFEAKKYHIINGCVVNPEIENREFIGKKYPQKCGDILLVVEKTTLKGKDGSFLFRCRFEKYPFEIFISDKRKIKEGTIVNPQTEQVEFINKIWPQNCEDSLRIIEQVAPRKWRCQFIKYPYEVISEKNIF